MTSEALDSVLELARAYCLPVMVAADGLGEDTISVLAGVSQPYFAVQAHARRRRYLVKRAFDVVAASVALVLLSPVLLVTAVIVRLSSPGPAIYTSWRVGVCLRPFPCFKFRTMSADAETRQAELEDHNEASGCLFKICDDPRVTGVGRILRRTSIDELPQLFNVLAGHMSLVGPRPLPLRDVALMDDHQKRRHAVLPGLTGLWQVSGRSDVGADEMVELDLRYIQGWSISLDLRILFGTFAAVFGSRGAY